MATFEIHAKEWNKTKVFEAIKKYHNNKPISVAKLAADAGVPTSQARYALVDMVEEGYIRRNVVKALDEHYQRFSYTLLKDKYIERREANGNTIKEKSDD